ncbi:MAG: hypothetical protein NC308_06470 [Clostridium sp.]|nr:hypothetical protein [Bacteroides sp.]MCM1198516.1 hypothetical protein [Clostridium sp.]
MDAKIFIILIITSLLPRDVYSQSYLKYVTIDKEYETLVGNEFKTDVKEYRLDIAGSHLQKICLDTLGSVSPDYCNELELRILDDSCAIGLIQSGTIVGDLPSHIAFCFADETVIVNRYFENAREASFLEIPLEIIELYCRHTKEHHVKELTVNGGIFYLLSRMITDNRFNYVYPEIHPAYYDLEWIHEIRRYVEPSHDFSLLKSFLYNHYIIGCSSDYLLYSMFEFVKYSRLNGRHKNKDVSEKNIIFDLIEMAALGTLPSLSSRLPYDYGLQNWNGKVMYPDYHELIFKKAVAIPGLQCTLSL